MVSQSGKKLVLETRNKEAGGRVREARGAHKPKDDSKLPALKGASSPSPTERKASRVRAAAAAAAVARTAGVGGASSTRTRRAGATTAPHGAAPLSARPALVRKGARPALGPAEPRRGRTPGAGAGAAAAGTATAEEAVVNPPKVVVISEGVDSSGFALRGEGSLEFAGAGEVEERPGSPPRRKKKKRKKKDAAKLELKRILREKNKRRTLALRMRNCMREAKIADEDWKVLKPLLLKKLSNNLMPLLRIAVEDLSNKYNHTFDQKARVIEKFKTDLDCDNIYTLMFHNYSSIVDKLMSNMEYNLKQLRDNFIKRVHQMQQEHRAQRDHHREMSHKDQVYAKLELLQVKTSFRVLLETLEADYILKCEAMRNKDNKHNLNLSSVLSHAAEKLYAKLVAIIKSYREYEKQAQDRNGRLLKRDINNRKINENCKEEIERLLRLKEVYQLKLQRALENQEDTLFPLHSQLQNLHIRKKVLLNDEKKSKSIQRQQMEDLVEISNTTVHWLEDRYNKARNILSMITIDRKFETQEEQIFPIIKFKQSKFQQSQNKTNKANQSTKERMRRFWKRVSCAEDLCRRLWHERNYLLQENYELKHYIYIIVNNLFVICPQQESREVVETPYVNIKYVNI